MAGIKISELPASSGATNTDLLPTAQGAETVKTTMAQILAYIQANLPGTALTQASQIFTITPTDITNKYVTLAHTPAVAANVFAFIQGNTPGVYGDDFTMATATRFSWNSLGFEDIIVSGDTLVVNYWY